MVPAQHGVDHRDLVAAVELDGRFVVDLELAVLQTTADRGTDAVTSPVPVVQLPFEEHPLGLAVLLGPVQRDLGRAMQLLTGVAGGLGDRKSTRLNSSHVKISYAVF